MTIVAPLRSEADYDAALEEIERYFEANPEVGTSEGDRFDLLARLIADYEAKHWPIETCNGLGAAKIKKPDIRSP
jgi:HTH-type transcriptional regulator/antitoxin HigA